MCLLLSRPVANYCRQTWSNIHARSLNQERTENNLSKPLYALTGCFAGCCALRERSTAYSAAR